MSWLRRLEVEVYCDIETLLVLDCIYFLCLAGWRGSAFILICWTSIFCYRLEYNLFPFRKWNNLLCCLPYYGLAKWRPLTVQFQTSGRLVFDVSSVFVAWFVCRFRRPAWLPVLCLCLVWRRCTVSVYSVCVPCEFCTLPSYARQALAFPCFKTTSKASQQQRPAWQTDFFPWNVSRLAAETVIASCDIKEDNQPTNHLNQHLQQFLTLFVTILFCSIDLWRGFLARIARNFFLN